MIQPVVVLLELGINADQKKSKRYSRFTGRVRNGNSMPLRPRPVIHPLTFQNRTLSVTAAAEAKQNQEKATALEQQVESLESDPFFVTIDGGGPCVRRY